MLKLKRGEEMGKINITEMPVDKWFAVVAGWVLKIINGHEYWTPNPYTLILHNPCDIFREYAKRRFKAPPPELLDVQDRFCKALLDISDAAALQERYMRRLFMLTHAAKWCRRVWLKRQCSKWYKNRLGRCKKCGMKEFSG